MNLRKIILLSAMVMTSTTLSAMRVSGRITVKRPTEIGIEDMRGQRVMSIPIAGNGDFTSEDVTLLPDVYVFIIGESREHVYLDGTDITIEGYLDADDAGKSQLIFTGIEANEKFMVMRERVKAGRDIPAALVTYGQKGVDPLMLAALAAMNPMRNYEDYTAVMKFFPADMAQSASGVKITEAAEKLSRYRIGAPAYDFKAVDIDGNEVSLKDFRGKYVLLDFWASWCNPCRQEIQRMKKFYPKYAHKNVVFISISLDETKEEWQTGLNGEQIPWTTLWDDSGGMNVSPLKDAYGFRSIPFIMIIDKQGNTIARGLRDTAIDDFLSSLEL